MGTAAGGSASSTSTPVSESNGNGATSTFVDLTLEAKLLLTVKTPEDLEKLLPQVRGAMKNFSAADFAALCGAASRAGSFEPELLAELLYRICLRMKTHANEFGVAELIEITASLAQHSMVDTSDLFSS